MIASKILIVEDDQTLLDVLKYNFVKDGHEVLTAVDGIRALELARHEKPDLIILDIMLPGLSGLDVCRILRKEVTTPVLMLTARVEEIDKIVGLELGADDYMTKPFSLRELLARVRALLRRTETMKQEISPADREVPPAVGVAGLTVDFARHLVSIDGSSLNLSPKEFGLLAFLIQNRGRVFSRDNLLEKVWGYDYAGDTRTVDVHVRWLRQKIETDPSKPQRLLTVRGIGYKFEG